MQEFELPISKFKVKPWKWQGEAIKRAIYQSNDFGIFAEQGTGKTYTMITILRCRYALRQRIMSTFIFAPLVTLYNWKEEFKKYSYINSRDVVVLKGSSKDKLKKMNEALESGKPKIFITNYESLINEELFNKVMNYAPEILVLDESHYVKTHNSKRSKKIAKIADMARHRYLLTGTPILNGVDDLYMQFRIMDGGETFGNNYHVFKGRYMIDMNERWKGKQNYFPKWVTNDKKYSELQNKMYRNAVRVLKKDCLDLPDLVVDQVYFDMAPDQKKAYIEMERDLITFIESKEKEGNNKAVVGELAIVKAIRLQQIASGFMVDEDGEVHEFKKNPKIDHLTEEVPRLVNSGHKVILWCAFKHNYVQLGRMLDKLKIKHAFITGEQTLDQKQRAQKDFTKGDTQVLVANRRAGGIGINLVESDYSYVYSRNFSLNDELQSEARNHRGGSEMHEKITKKNLIMSNTIEVELTKALTNKKDLSDNVLDIIRR